MPVSLAETGIGTRIDPEQSVDRLLLELRRLSERISEMVDDGALPDEAELAFSRLIRAVNAVLQEPARH